MVGYRLTEKPQYSRAFEPLAATLQSIEERLANIEGILREVLTAGKTAEPIVPDTWLTTKQVAKYLNTPEVTIRQWRDRGTRGPRSYKIGGKVQYKKTEVDAWVESQARDTLESLDR